MQYHTRNKAVFLNIHTDVITYTTLYLVLIVRFLHVLLLYVFLFLVMLVYLSAKHYEASLCFWKQYIVYEYMYMIYSIWAFL